MKKSILQASFEESLKLEEDGFRKLQQEQHDKTARKFRQGVPTFGFKIQCFILTMLFPVGFSYLLSLGAAKFTTNDLGQLKVQPASQNFFPWQVYILFLSIWLLLIIIGKLFHQAFILPYRYQFHLFSFLLIFYAEVDLAMFGILLANLPIYLILGYVIIWIFLVYFMFTSKIKAIRKNLFNNDSQPTFQDKIAKAIGIYGIGLLGLAFILQKILTMFFGKVPSSLEDIGMLIIFMIANILMPAILIFIGIPYFLQAYYKLKYPEQYRKYEGKSWEEFYGQKYLKKHKELLNHETR